MKKYLLLLYFFHSSFLLAANEPPRLIVQIVIDQLRGDLLTQYREGFGTDGFNYLLNHGINYQNTHHPHALTVTCVGHATIATGSTPSLHGIVANDWYDPVKKKLVYCTEDAENHTLPTVRSANPGPGQSPRHMLVSTFSDELVLAQRGRAFAVSLKDRSAITLAGHAGKAFWFDKKHGGFVTSWYYYHQYPKWVSDWNISYQPRNQRWELMSPTKTYRFTQVPLIQHAFQGFGETFPHKLGDPSSPTYYDYLAMSPFADELTADFAMTLLQEEKLGKTDKKTDYLAISFSAVDVIGHQLGLHSIESEDNLRHLDKTMAKLLHAIDTQVGLKHTLIVLTADHGMEDSPNWLTMNGIQTSPALNIEHLQQSMNKILHNQFNLPAEAIQFFKLPYIYLNHQLLAEKKLSVAAVSSYLAARLCEEPGIFKAYPLPLIHSEHDWLSNKVSKMSFPNRAGDIFLVFKPYQKIPSLFEALFSHGSPWNYDSYVPLLFSNPDFIPSRITRSVHTTDIAITLAELLFIKPPSASVGYPLHEIIQQYDNITPK